MNVHAPSVGKQMWCMCGLWMYLTAALWLLTVCDCLLVWGDSCEPHPQMPLLFFSLLFRISPLWWRNISLASLQSLRYQTSLSSSDVHDQPCFCFLDQAPILLVVWLTCLIYLSRSCIFGHCIHQPGYISMANNTITLLKLRSSGFG